MAANQPLDDTVVVGIDFGTTFSGVSWAHTREPDAIEIVTCWDSELNHCSDVEKAPTQLYFDANDHDIKWGYGIPLDKEPLKWFKLLLLDNIDLPADVASADLLERSKFQVVLTLPTIWPPYAQNRMKQATQQSGILDGRPAGTTMLQFISEPEAAALATIKDMGKRSTVETGDTVVVCDAGGGTVGDGDLCGGVFLDEGFMKLVKEKTPTVSWSSVSKLEEKKFLNDEWEHGIKPQFENQMRTWPVYLPGSCNSNSSASGLKRRETLDLSSDEIQSVFLPIAIRIEALVRLQVDAIEAKYYQAPKYIILVGGFGRSRYLFNHLQGRFQSTILQSNGNKPWTAICRGVVVRRLMRYNPSSGLGMVVASRVARMSYGIKYFERFVHGKHKKKDRFWCSKRNSWMANNQMQWFLSEGDDISEKRSVHHNYLRLLEGDVFDVSEEIYCSTSFPPPSRYDGNKVRSLCNISWNRNVDTKSLPKFTNDYGESFLKLSYRVEMDCEDGIINFAVYSKGRKVAGREVDVQFV
ncbi:unnamed protein product [Fusarium graminearum]|uniref:Uncharacterized protein n=1 Tax=Gibberella zeae TaxID=5518 RepID=A0A4E9E8Q8_GIBZA|nr:hypothetical protein FG05_00850 [Fusarium graminearum]KAI6761311.1 hypothetical protein HG531_001864 [Fusarium graminearum]CAF3512579.1 unnamed protein product [Fusarium graminearum]CAG1967175.1 unnamed protein product [Fusarium graminearum]CAG1994939.1 unnamed protein product [Fusarium graminearum]